MLLHLKIENISGELAGEEEASVYFGEWERDCHWLLCDDDIIDLILLI